MFSRNKNSGPTMAANTKSGPTMAEIIEQQKNAEATIARHKYAEMADALKPRNAEAVPQARRPGDDPPRPFVAGTLEQLHKVNEHYKAEAKMLDRDIAKLQEERRQAQLVIDATTLAIKHLDAPKMPGNEPDYKFNNGTNSAGQPAKGAPPSAAEVEDSAFAELERELAK
jgi:hypothetical protein